ncbi:hypothetical protein DFP72DRAFT_1058200 [Ephemerocybe angulata]|uniref:Aldehyde dehydrogenase domain-containing protein n=1 Tax=Ephemerocybe angulata TaxID=980116 RepID=A0A8H6IKH4_9AGAR|nr:hypothetical protein DFP72DRAFT_1058200 [Tulosesus angulatus]
MADIFSRTGQREDEQFELTERTQPGVCMEMGKAVREGKRKIDVQENADTLCHAWLDEGKPRQEVVIGEMGAVIGRALRGARELEASVGGGKGGEEIGEDVQWEGWQEAGNARVEKKARARLPRTHQTIPKYLDPAAYRVALGGVPEITKILELKWAHILYTGNTRVAYLRSSSEASDARLGGKSPVIIDGRNLGEEVGVVNYAGKRDDVLWGDPRFFDWWFRSASPQTTASSNPPTSQHSSKHAAQPSNCSSPGGALNSADYGRIVSEAHFTRVKGLLRDTKRQVVIGGGAVGDEEGEGKGARARGGEGEGGRGRGGARARGGRAYCCYEATAADDVLLQDELFAPILPIVPVASVTAALDESVKKEVKAGTMSGNVVFNDTFNQLSVDEIPFGGIGESGYGRQPLNWMFEEFVYLRSVVEVPFSEEPKFGGHHPPSSKETLDFFEGCLKVPIPSVEELGEFGLHMGWRVKESEMAILQPGMIRVEVSTAWI